MAPEKTLLPKLNGHWTPAESRVRKNNYRLQYDCNKSTRKFNQSPRKSEMYSKNDIDRRILYTRSSNPRMSVQKKENNISMKRLSLQTIEKSEAFKKDDDLTNEYDSLKVFGVGVNGNMLLPRKQQYEEKLPKRDEQVTKHTHVQSPRKAISRNPFLLTNTANTNRPRLTSRSSIEETLLYDRNNQDEKAVVINNYLRRENARYASDEMSVKKVLFENWLNNIKIEDYDFNDRSSSYNDSIIGSDT